MVHLRIVAPRSNCSHVLELLEDTETVVNVAYFKDAVMKPPGDMIFCDVATRDVSLLVADLRELNVDREGSISIEEIDAEIGMGSTDLHRRRRDDIGAADPVVWENVARRTSESVELSHSFLIFMALAMQIAAVGIYFNQPILIVGAMVVGPDFGPIAGVCVALVQRDIRLARRSMRALLVGIAVGVVLCFFTTLLLQWAGALPKDINFDLHTLTRFISNPDFFSVYVAVAAGVIGVLSLTTAKSSVLVGVLISVTTIPAAANIGVAAAYHDWSTAWGATAQLLVNLTSIFIAGFTTLYIQRRRYVRRRRAHLRDPSRRDAGLPIGKSRREGDKGYEPSVH
ncbi:MAG: DUF389 domain-containing protein [Solirubrobacterales bacterium]|nr:DUF389 domain-containing protein [Solirubrobacterales bacterium]MCB8971419.1 DUF389 domain-containing protein [Thermoleophilales bacterium]